MEAYAEGLAGRVAELPLDDVQQAQVRALVYGELTRLADEVRFSLLTGE